MILQSLFQEKDVRDYRYFYKRAFFLACLKQAIDKAGLPIEASYTYQNGNQRKPILRLLPVKGRFTLATRCLLVKLTSRSQMVATVILQVSDAPYT